jgi:hypothetical protein
MPVVGADTAGLVEDGAAVVRGTADVGLGADAAVVPNVVSEIAGQFSGPEGGRKTAV